MKINVDIREDGKEIMFVSDKDGNNIGEIEISKKLYEIAFNEWKT